MFLFIVISAFFNLPFSGETNVLVGMTGPSTVERYSTHTYDCSECPLLDNNPAEWNVTGGAIVSQSGRSKTVTIQWTHSSSGRVEFLQGGYVAASKDITILSPPSAPPTPLYEYQCTSAELQFNGSPPSGTTWYWQTSSSGTSTSNSSSTWTITSPGTYYLRAKNQIGWSSATSVFVPGWDSDPPGTLSTTLFESCNVSNITMGSYHSTDEWYTSSTGGSPVHVGSSFTVSISPGQTKTYWVLLKTAFGCAASSRTQVTAKSWETSIGGSMSSNTTTFCNSSTVTFTSSGKRGTIKKWQYREKIGSGSWSTWSTFSTSSSTTRNKTITNNSSQNLYAQVRVQVQNGVCSSTYSSAKQVTVEPATVAGSVSGTSNRCGSGTETFSISGHVGTVHRWQYRYKNGSGSYNSWSTFEESNNVTSKSLSLSQWNSGRRTYQVRAVVKSGSTCNTLYPTKTMTVDPVTVAGTVSSSVNSRCGTGNVTFSISGQTGTVHRWQKRYKNGSGSWSGWSTFQETNNDYSISESLSQWSSGDRTWEIRAVIKSGSLCSTLYPSTQVVVKPQTVAGTVSSSTSSRCGTGNVTFSISGQTGTVKRWQKRYKNGSGSWSTWSTFQESDNDYSIAHSLSQWSSGTRTWEIQAVVQRGSCATYTPSTQVTVYPQTVAGTVSSNIGSRCGTGNVTFSISGQSGTVHRWQKRYKNGSGSWSTWSTFQETNNDYSIAHSLSQWSSGTRTWEIQAVVQRGSCATYTPSTQVTVYPQTVAGTVSSSTSSRCGTGNVTFSISGQSGTVKRWQKRYKDGSGSWNPWSTFQETDNDYSIAHSLSEWSGGTRTWEIQAVVQRGSCATYTPSTQVTVYPQTVAGTVSSNIGSRCGTGNVTFSISGQSGTVHRWQKRYKNGSGSWSSWSTFQETDNDYSIAHSLSQWSGGTRTWEIQAVVQRGSCDTYTPSTQVTVDPTPELAIGSNAARCGSGTVTLTAGPGNNGYTIRWYSASSGGSLLYTGTSYTTPTLSSSTTYYAASYNSSTGCIDTDRKAITAIIDPIPSLANGSDEDRCGSGTVTLTASPGNNGNTIRWYSASSGGSLLYTGTSYTTPTLSSSTTYYAASYNSSTGCMDTDRKAITAIINNNPTVSAGSNITVYASTPAFSITGGSPSGGIWSGSYVSGNQFDPQQSGEGSFTVTYTYVDGNGCDGTDTKTIDVVSNPIPTPNTTSISLGESATITLSGYTNYQWYKDNTSISGAIQSSYTTTSPGTYHATFTDGQGISGTSQSVTIAEDNSAFGNYNYIISHAIKQEGITDDSEITGLTEEQQSVSIQYFDGLGRPMQTVGWRASPTSQDIVQPIVYDQFGRDSVSFLPYTDGNDGSFKANAIDPSNYSNSDQYAFYQDTGNDVVTDAYPFAKKIFEASPLNRVTEQGAPGQAWQPGNHTVENSWRTNTSNEVPRYEGDNDQLVQNGYYDPNELWVTTVTDEEDHEVVTYTDKEGQTILKSVEGHETHYVYDDFNQLRFVLPPKQSEATSPLSSTNIQELSFIYGYDEYRRMIYKKVPGADTVFMVYDQWDRLVLTQDAVQRTSNKWTFTTYDGLNRPVITGFLTDSRDQATLQTYIMGLGDRFLTYDGSGAHGYDDGAYPFTNIGTGALEDILSVTYYDTYDHLSLSGWTTEFDFAPVSAVGLTSGDQLDPARGQVTGSKTRVLGTSDFMNSVVYYDHKYRVIQTTAHNDNGSITRSTNEYDFIGKVLTTKTEHLSGSFTEPITEYFTYDHADRLITAAHQIGSEDTVTISEQVYNEIGQLKEKNLHVSPPVGGAGGGPGGVLQSLDYQYNIRGWLTKLNEADLSADGSNEYSSMDHFGMQLQYDDAGSTYAQHNGNIGRMLWKTSLDLSDQQYAFSYDALNRLKKANYTSLNKINYFSVTGDDNGIRYDANGNILNLQRYGEYTPGDNDLIDILSYEYQGNQLTSVGDTKNYDLGFTETYSEGNQPNEYLYDANGNMITDENKGIDSIRYNHLNLPEAVYLDTISVFYTYDAAGIKLKKITISGNDTTVTRYQGPLVFENDTLQFIQHAEGRIIPPSGGTQGGVGAGFTYEYHLKDHLGNVRMTLTSAQESYTYLATMETELATEEEGLFGNIAETRQLDLNYDHTHLVNGFGDNSARLNANESNRVVGPTLSLYVNAGDTVKMKAYAKYLGTPGSNSSTFVIADEVTSGFGLVSGGETAEAYSAINSLLGSGSGFLGFSSDPDLPKAYLTYHYFDTDHNYITSGFMQVSSASNGAFEELSLQLTADQQGYVYIYVGNETQDDFNVFFDDLEVEHSYGPIVQKDDYYPFGLTHSSYQRALSKPNYIKFQGQEEQKETGWISFKWRNHQPDIGRFFNVDPLAESFYYNSPYAFSENKVTAHVELEGLEAAPIHPGQNPWTMIEVGFSNFFGGVADVVGDLFSGELFTRSSTETTVKEKVEVKQGASSFEVSSNQTLKETTTTHLETYFFSYGEQGVTKKTETTTFLEVEGTGKAQGVPVYAKISQDGNGNVEGSAGVGTADAQAGIFANTEGETGVKGEITIPIANTSATTGNVTTGIEVERTYSTDIYIKRD